MIRTTWILLAVVTTTAFAAAPADPSRHAFDRARWSVARQDTLQSADLLRAVDPGSGPHARAVLLRLALQERVDDTTSGRAGDRERTWSTLLRWEAGASLPDDDASAIATLLDAATALDAGDRETAERRLADIDPPRALRVLTAHLRVLAAPDESVARRRSEALAREEPHSAADRTLVDDAALRCGAHALQRGDDPTPWFDRLDPDGDTATWASWLLALHAGTPEALDAWIAEHPEHRGATEARLRRAGLALDAGDDVDARARHLELEAALAARDDELSAIATDSTRMRAWTDALWAGDGALRPDAAHWRERRDALTDALVLDRDTPKTEDLSLSVDTARDDRIDPVDRVTHERLRAELDATVRDFDRARRALARAEQTQDARARYRARGLERLDALADDVGAAGASLDTLVRATPELLAELRAVEDSLLARIDRRTTRLAARARAQADHARDLARWYGRGPMARRDPAPHPEVPVPADHLDAEESFARALGTTLDDFATRTPVVIRRSFSDVFARRLDGGSSTMRARNDSLATHAAALRDTVRATRDAVGDELLQARTALAEARSRRAAAARLLDDHRDAVARAVLARERTVLDARREAVAYGTAVATTRLALGGDTALRDEARARWEAFVTAGCDPRVRGDARYRWADLELVAAREDFQQRMGAWLDGDDDGGRALAPLLDIEPALALFRDILDEDPGFAHRDLVLLHLGMLHADRGDPEATAYLTQLVEDHPASSHVAEAQLRRGEIAFDAGDHEAALGPLRAATTADDPEIRAVALYKAGWSAHATGRLLEAIDTFDALLDLYASDHAPASFDLADEARELYLRAVARAGGAPAFAASLERNGERDDAPELLAALSALLTEYALYDQAGAADRLFLDRYATHPGALDAARRWIDDEARRAGVEAADAALLRVVDRFEPGGPWAAAQDDSLRRAGEGFARDGLVGVTARRHEALREEPDPRGWRDTRALYVRLASTWPDDPDLSRWNLLAGECALAVDDHAHAFDHFAVAARDSGTVGTQAAWQTVVTTDAWYRSTIPADATVGADSLARRFVAQADAYRARRPRAEGNADLAWRALRIGLAHGWDDEVVARATDFSTAYADDPRHVDAARLVAEALYRRESYLEASTAFEHAAVLAHAAGRDSVATDLETWVPHSFELHVRAIDANTPADAAPLWRTFADRWPDHASAEAALYRSGLGFETAEEDSLALDAWRTVLDRHPDGEYAMDAHRNLARALEETGDLDGAVTALVAFTDAYPDADDAADALLHAVDLEEKAGDVAGRDALLDTYLTRHPDDLQTLQAVRESRARASIEAGTGGPEVEAYLAFAAAHPDRASNDLLARHAFQQADRAWDAYAAMTLTQPLEASLAAKRDTLTALLEDYRAVAERAVAPWAQAASTRIGEALLVMGDALLASERPDGLTGDDRLAYDEVIEEQAWTFFDRGEGALREVLRHATRDSDDRWASRARHLLFPRIAQRFLHQPSFDYPVLESADATGNDTPPRASGSHAPADGASDLHTSSR